MKPLFASIMADLQIVKERYGKAKISTALINRGFHALLAYRLSCFLSRLRVPLLPLALTRLTQILYGIDIDLRARLAGGICIVHGIGLVIGAGAVVETGCLLYHGVTLGIKGSGRDDGFPTIGPDCVLGAGCKILGKVSVGEQSIVGANVVLLQSVEPGSIVKPPVPIIGKRRPTSRTEET